MDGAAFAEAPPPQCGFGNYKGVMLCSRPADGPARHGAGDNQPPFKPTIAATAGEPLGLLRTVRKPEHDHEVKLRGPSAALRRHCQWIKELQVQIRQDQQAAEEGARRSLERDQRMKEAFAQQRNAIRQIKLERALEDIDPEEVHRLLQPKAKKPAAPKKPLWAMTEGEQQGFQDDEAADLISFAENLDFDEYIHDLEFRHCLQVVRDRAKKLQREQDAFKESLLREFNSQGDEEADTQDGRSACRAQRKGAGAADTRSCAGSSLTDNDDAVATDEAASVQADAEQLWSEVPQLRAVHSKGSVRRLVERERLRKSCAEEASARPGTGRQEAAA